VEKVATFKVCGWFLPRSDNNRFLGVAAQDNMCRHVSSMKQLAY
jgi:hypothetical protein